MDDATVRDLSYDLAVAVGRINRRMRGREYDALGHGHLSTITTLSKSGPMRLGELAAIESVSAPSMTRTVTDLEARGLVRRLPDPNDGRSVLVELTDDGAGMVREARAHRADMMAAMLGELEPDGVEALRAALPALEELATRPS